MITQQQYHELCMVHGGHPYNYQKYLEIGTWLFDDGRVIIKENKNDRNKNGV
tara:strand:- start:2709 stop:2864 length:156 start_codon:yes stop_codon:yes gene_type:complete